MKAIRYVLFIGLLLILVLASALPGAAQEESQPTPTPTPQKLTVFTEYPSQLIGFGEVVTVPLKLRAGRAQRVSLEVKGLPEGWNASFRSGARVIEAVYLDGSKDLSVDLRLEPPAEVKAGKIEISVIANGEGESAEFPLTFTIKEKLPPRLTLKVEGLPTQRGAPTASFRFTATLKNEGGEDLLVTLIPEQPKDVQVTVETAGQQVTELQLAANESRTLTIRAEPLITLQAGKYPFKVQAKAGEVSATLDLTIEVVGEGRLSISAPDGRLSGEAVAGRDSPLKIVLRNDGTAPLRGVELSSSEPSGWSVTFDQQKIAEIPAGDKVEVTATIKPHEKAVAGDYILTISARPVDGKMESADFRITVRTSTLWGLVGIALIAIAVAAVSLAVSRFGRR